jgi:two-component system nitrogen regulation response regulator NtrX
MAERILIVDDSAGTRESLGGVLRDEGYVIRTASSGAEARAALEREGCEVVLLDLLLPDEDGLELLGELRRSYPELPVIVISGHGNVETAVKATRLGAYDFLEKPLALERVALSVGNAIDRGRMARKLEQLSSQLRPTEELVGSSPAMRKLKSELRRAAASDSRILIVGENGTGKELVARRAHLLSRRAAAPFVEVNCAAIPEELIESELFGHVKGSFTGASADRAGRFEQADGGTLFLDEVADMSLKTQAKVLRVLQEQRFERVGGTASIQVDVRVVAATNKELETELRENRFREDLYFRLAVIPLRVPPLRERRDDVPELVEHFIARYAGELGKPPKRVAPEVMEQLRAYSWPGNVRELRNLVERMMIMVPGDEIELRDLPPQLRSETPDPVRDLLDGDSLSLRQARAAFEKHLIERRLEACGGNVAHTARTLGVERSSLYRKMKSYGVDTSRE